MALKETIHRMKTLLTEVVTDLEKSVKGNKAAAQRARTATITLAKIAKTYRSESIAAEKKEKPSAQSKPLTKSKMAVAPSPVQVKRPTAKIPSRRK